MSLSEQVRPLVDRFAGMAHVPGGTFLMGSDNHYADERPQHPVRVAGFWLDEISVTNAAFAAFVGATGYVTVAERPLDPVMYPGATPRCSRPGGSCST